MRLMMLAVVTALAVGCRQGEPQPAASPADTPQAEGIDPAIRFSADTRVLESFPVQLHTTLEVRNAGGPDYVRLEFASDCVVLLRVYDSEARDVPVWDQADSARCSESSHVLMLGGGYAEEFTTTADARQILGTSLPPGRYWLSAYVRVNDRVVEVPAGSAELDAGR
jgi:hypothetical protein